jgi:hypothetical protein
LFFLLNSYIGYFYDISLNDYYQWLTSSNNPASKEKTSLVFSCIFFFLSAVFLNSFIGSIQLKLFGKFDTQIYLGNSSEYTSVYTKINSQGITLIPTTEISYNDSFRYIGKSQKFIANSSVTTDLGKPYAAVSAGNLFGSIVVCSLFFVIMLGPVHEALSSMLKDSYTGEGQNFYGYEFNYSFNALLALKGLSIEKWVMLWATLLFLFLYCFFKFPRTEFGERAFNLPSHISANEIIKGIPVEIKTIYIQEIDRNDNRGDFETIETKGRHVTFKFDKGFQNSVYVTTTFDVDNNESIEAEIEQNIVTRSNMMVKVTSDLRVVLNAPL